MFLDLELKFYNDLENVNFIYHLNSGSTPVTPGTYESNVTLDTFYIDPGFYIIYGLLNCSISDENETLILDFYSESTSKFTTYFHGPSRAPMKAGGGALIVWIVKIKERMSCNLSTYQYISTNFQYIWKYIIIRLR